MRIIFLDIDGVLLNRKTIGKIRKEVELPIEGESIGFIRLSLSQLDPECIANLNRVTDATDAKIVISSSWRYNFREKAQFPFLVDYLKECGVTGEIIGRTPIYSEYRDEVLQGSRLVGVYARGREIQMWLDANPKAESFVIVDDGSDMDHLTHKLVQTEFEIGITLDNALKMIEVLYS